MVQAIWAKGYTELLGLVEKDHATSEMHTAIDCYGYGDDLHEVCCRHCTLPRFCFFFFKCVLPLVE